MAHFAKLGKGNILLFADQTNNGDSEVILTQKIYAMKFI